ncbi:alternative ribosome rescue aminoacyl-tRNA hydrolase ArfB [Treponema sp.]|uniref:alternative ribosome rescue aminoacyl-tRNA hydrolase ArfB n=1 Tax=Treponema sp. TaxID=166 RepID=UPI003F0BB893
MDREALHNSILSNASISFSRSGGKGGQNVNKVNTKVRLSIPVSKISGLSEKEYELLAKNCKPFINKNFELFTDCEETRFQGQNRKNAFERLEAKIIAAVKITKKRIKTKPTAASKEKRLKSKKIRSLLKHQRLAVDLP